MEGEKSKIGLVTAIGLIFVSIIVDLVILLFNFIPILGWAINLLVTFLAYLLFYMWFKLLGINFFEGRKSTKKILSMAVGAFGGAIPLIGIIAWTVSVLCIIAITWGEEKAAKVLASDSKMGKMAQKGMSQAQNNLSRMAKTASKEEGGNIAFAQKELKKINDQAQKIREQRKMAEEQKNLLQEREQLPQEEQEQFDEEVAEERGEGWQFENVPTYPVEDPTLETPQFENAYVALKNKPDKTREELSQLEYANNINQTGHISVADRNNPVYIAAYDDYLKQKTQSREMKPNNDQESASETETKRRSTDESNIDEVGAMMPPPSNNSVEKGEYTA